MDIIDALRNEARREPHEKIWIEAVQEILRLRFYVDLPDKTYCIGDRVRKKSGSQWQGRVVGFYRTKLTPEGYAVESECHSGSVQIYPVAALEAVE